MIFHVPADPEQLRAFGAVSIRHGHLDHVLRMTIKTLEGITPEQAMEKTKRIGSAKLRKWIRREALKVLGEGDAFDQLQALLSRCRDLTERRNDVIHGTIGKELDGEPQMRSEDNRWVHCLARANLMHSPKRLEFSCTRLMMLV